MGKMNFRMFVRAVCGLILLFSVSSAIASPAIIIGNVTIDISGLAGRDISLDFMQYDYSGVVGDSWNLIDNVALDSGTPIDFEGGDMGGFVVDPLNPGSVNIVPGSITGGSSVLRIDEDLSVTPTITWKDYPASSGLILSFDFHLVASDTVGFWGLDGLEVNITDGSMGENINALYIDAGEITTSAETTLTIIPEPASSILLLGGAGIGLVGWFRKRRTI